MAKEPRPLAVRVSILANARLLEIWRWNADRYAEAHADAYVEFLINKTRDLPRFHSIARPVPGRPALLYMTFKKRARGHGHLIVFQISDTELFVVDYFHTAQDWMTQLPRDSN